MYLKFDRKETSISSAIGLDPIQYRREVETFLSMLLEDINNYQEIDPQKYSKHGKERVIITIGALLLLAQEIEELNTIEIALIVCTTNKYDKITGTFNLIDVLEALYQQVAQENNEYLFKLLLSVIVKYVVLLYSNLDMLEDMARAGSSITLQALHV